MAGNLALFCLVDEQPRSRAFEIDISATRTVAYLKDLIKFKKAPEFDDIAPDRLTLWLVSVPVAANKHKPIVLSELESAIELDNPRTQLSALFPESPDDTTYIVVQRPPQAPKRNLEDEGSSPKKKRLGTSMLRNAIEAAGLKEKGLVNGKSNLSLLNNKDRVSVVSFLGQDVDMTNSYNALVATAEAHRGSHFHKSDVISTPSGIRFPVVGTKDVFLRQTCKDLYNDITLSFQDRPGDESWKRVIVTGTAGIGKSAFLVYFTIRLLATSSDDNPPIVVFHEKRGSKCYVYGGLSTLRYGDIEDFQPFLHLPET
ncbi:hypothetical protein EDD11_001070 [Mortierella claussenii]|nr:hypothetical protein EDD11_001070 [Mortierella claussenii]